MKLFSVCDLFSNGMMDVDFRFALPQPKLVEDEITDFEYEMAERFFGKENLKEKPKVEEIPALSPLTLFCKDKYTFDKISGLSAKFCRSQLSQTDVGICVGKDYSFVPEYGTVKVQEINATVDEDLRNAEHVYILSANEFSNVNDPSTLKVKIHS